MNEEEFRQILIRKIKTYLEDYVLWMYYFTKINKLNNRQLRLLIDKYYVEDLEKMDYDKILKNINYLRT